MRRNIRTKGLHGLVVIIMTLIVFVANEAKADPCEPDRAKFCHMFRPDDPRRLYCLKGIESQLKPGCRATLKNIQGNDIDFIDDCEDDYFKFCRDVPEGRGRVLKCFKANSKKLTFECRKRVNGLPSPD